ncbi:sugar transferase [Candidatus Daviesbacteria bacterium]|nr:sugar transferase [Candidatus Daviesbacteria bacterium]
MLYEVTKRIIDVILAIGLVIIFLPIMVITAIAIKIDSPGPIIYKQLRVGRGGREFWIYKFRSMKSNAEEMLAKNPQLLAAFKEGDWKLGLHEDPRVTRVGRFIRSVTIDEMPQFWNVLAGQMSIVGPRAYRREELAEQQDKYPETVVYVEQILKVKPGITGPWQVSGRNELPFDLRTHMDAEYAQSRSLLRDILIIFKTPFAMLSKW